MQEGQVSIGVQHGEIVAPQRDVITPLEELIFDSKDRGGYFKRNFKTSKRKRQKCFLSEKGRVGKQCIVRTTLKLQTKKNAKARDRFLYTLVESNCNTLTVRGNQPGEVRTKVDMFSAGLFIALQDHIRIRPQTTLSLRNIKIHPP